MSSAEFYFIYVCVCKAYVCGVLVKFFLLIASFLSLNALDSMKLNN